MSINNNNIWELAESWLSGTLSGDEAAQLQKQLEEDIDFANQFHECADLIRSMEDSGKEKRFRSMLGKIHAEQEIYNAGKRKGITLPAHFWRTAGIAAGVALVTSLITYSIVTDSFKKTESQYNLIRRQVDNIKESQNQLKRSQSQLETDIRKMNTPKAQVKYTGTGFALNNNGYFVTSYHVINGADSVYIQDQDGDYFKADVYAADENTDIAVLKVEKKNFHFGKSDVPYTFANSKAGLGDHIYTLGYPKDQLIYSEGYISGRAGFEGNDNQYSLVLPAGHGQSGSPVIDADGNVIGIVTAVSDEAEANTYAVTSRALLDLLHRKSEDNAVRLPKTNKLGGMSREAQIKKMGAYTFSVKVYKK